MTDFLTLERDCVAVNVDGGSGSTRVSADLRGSTQAEPGHRQVSIRGATRTTVATRLDPIQNGVDMPRATGKTSRLTHILVANDDSDLLAVLRDILVDEGYGVTTCIEPDGVIDGIRASEPDLVILDPLMRGAEDWAVVDRLQEDAALANLPCLVASTAVDALTAREHTLRQQGVAVMPMPFDLEHLLGLIQQMIGPAGREWRAPAGDAETTR